MVLIKLFFRNFLKKTLGIVGSKDYRKPEWVTHMEEMQKALKGMYSLETFKFEIFNKSLNSLLKRV